MDKYDDMGARFAYNLAAEWGADKVGHRQHVIGAEYAKALRAVATAAHASGRREIRGLLEEAHAELTRACVFIGTREKMHPDGIALWDELCDRITAAIRALDVSPPETLQDVMREALAAVPESAPVDVAAVLNHARAIQARIHETADADTCGYVDVHISKICAILDAAHDGESG